MNQIDTMSVNAIRVLAADAVQKAKSGHPGLPLGAAAMSFELWAKHMNHNPKNPGWENRDRFILSGGHGSTLLYSLLHLFGYGLTKEDMMNFRQMDSLTQALWAQAWAWQSAWLWLSPIWQLYSTRTDILLLTIIPMCWAATAA